MTFPQCSARGRIRTEVQDCFCRHPEFKIGRPVATLAQCMACPFAGSNEPVPPQRPRVGDVLAEMIHSRYAQTIRGGCDCESHVREMNEWGPDGCETRLEEIVGWLIESASKVSGPHNLAPDWAKRWRLRPLVIRAITAVRDWQPAIAESSPASTTTQPTL